jgi:hypothetical protein
MVRGGIDYTPNLCRRRYIAADFERTLIASAADPDIVGKVATVDGLEHALEGHQHLLGHHPR